jgi:hypothetical protein
MTATASRSHNTRGLVYGVDFSGARDAGRKIWIARGIVCGQALHVDVCSRAGDLPGGGEEWAACLAAMGAFIAQQRQAIFGLDFPLGLPRPLANAASRSQFVCTFLGRYDTPDQSRADCYVLAAVVAGRELKRATDRESGTPWCSYNLRIYRQTLYGLRELLAPLVRDDLACVLPMQSAAAGRPWLIEICPALTLKHHELYAPYKGGGAGQRTVRERVMRAMEQLAPLDILDAGVREAITEDSDGDALDSVVAARATWCALQRLEAFAIDGNPPYAVDGYVYV